MTSRKTKHEWTAFREADLFTKDGNSYVNRGESFVMPGEATVTLSVYDDDSKLGANAGRWDRSVDRTQDAYIDGEKVGRDNDIYVDKIHLLKGSDGKYYKLVEMGVENHDADGAGDDYFTFAGAVPPAGVELTVIRSKNVGWRSGIDYEDLGAGSVEADDADEIPEGFQVLDFEGLATGETVLDQFDGVTITAEREAGRRVDESTGNDAMIFDSENPTGGDYDLRYDDQGNILIISEDNDADDPDDAAHGGSLTFDFDRPSALDSIVLLDVEEKGGTIVLNLTDGTTREIPIPAAGDNSAQTIQLDATGVTSMTINLVGSGAVDDLVWQPGVGASVGDRVFIDANENGQQDDGEVGVEGVAVELIDLNGGENLSTTTDSEGNYLFEDLDAGDYQVQFDTSDAFVFTDANSGNDASDSDANQESGLTDVISLGEGEQNLTVDAGLVELSCLEQFYEALPENVEYEVAGTLAGDAAFDLTIMNSGNPDLDGILFEQAYCLAFFDPIPLDTPITGAVFMSNETSQFDADQVSGFNGEVAAENLDLIRYILSQDWENNDAVDFNGWDVQFAIWELTDNIDTDNWDEFFTGVDSANVDAILADAAANGEGFEFDEHSGMTAIIIDPDPQSEGLIEQPFIVSVEVDCIC